MNVFTSFILRFGAKMRSESYKFTLFTLDSRSEWMLTANRVVSFSHCSVYIRTHSARVWNRQQVICFVPPVYSTVLFRKWERHAFCVRMYVYPDESRSHLWSGMKKIKDACRLFRFPDISPGDSIGRWGSLIVRNLLQTKRAWVIACTQTEINNCSDLLVCEIAPSKTLW